MAQRWCTTISRFFARRTRRGGVGMVMVRACASKSISLSIPSRGHNRVCAWRGSPQSTAPASPRIRVGLSSVPLSSGRIIRGSSRW